MIEDPRLTALRGALEHRAPQTLVREKGEQEAAVALVVRPHDELELLLIKRALRPDDPWSGHMALPGGRRAADDRDLLTTALRETEEETGIPPGATMLIGSLDEVAPRSRHLPPLVIAPFVVSVPHDTPAIADPREVDATLWIPVSALRRDEAVSEIVIGTGEGETRRAFPSLVYREHVIWGLTHRMLVQFLELAALVGV